MNEDERIWEHSKVLLVESIGLEVVYLLFLVIFIIVSDQMNTANPFYNREN